MRVQELMQATVHSVRPDFAAEEAWQIMQTKGIRHLVVKDGSTVVGVLSDSDAGGPSGAPLRAGADVADLMNRHFVSVAPGDTVRKAANLMTGHFTGCLPVIERGKLVGVVTVTDMLEVMGKGGDRPAHNARASLHHRVPHKKVRTATGRW
jgi:acetoin utilization protein AcuB